MLLRLILVPTGHKSHATDPCEVPSSPSHTVHAVCSLAVRWDRSTSWISVWLTAPAVPVVRQLTVNSLLGVIVMSLVQAAAEQVGKDCVHYIGPSPVSFPLPCL